MITKTDRELLELAAGAAGIEIARSRLDDSMWNDMLLVGRPADGNAIGWNPLNNSGDALELAVKLRIGLWYEFEYLEKIDLCAEKDGITFSFTSEGDENAAMRRAIVKAAAAIGESMP